MPEYETFEHDVLVIGAGGAGLRAAIEARRPAFRVGLVCKSFLGKAHTVMAEGGIAAALANVDDRDNWKVHFADTMRGGQYVNQWRMAELHAKEAPDRVRELEAWGAVFDRTKDGRILQRNFGGHKYPRLAHVGDRTGLEMIRTLQDHGVHQGIDVHMEHTILSLAERWRARRRRVWLRTRARTLQNFPRQSGRARDRRNRAGLQDHQQQLGIHRRRSRARLSTRARNLIDMEFVQFHPTGMVWPPSVCGILVTEGVRGEGGILTNKEGRRFMFDSIPENYRAQTADNEEEGWRYCQGDKNARRPPELLTRDHVARCIVREIKEGRGSPARRRLSRHRLDQEKTSERGRAHQEANCRACITSSNNSPTSISRSSRWKSARPRITSWAACAWMPIRKCRACPGLFAAGECAAGINGANRLGGNSLSDLLVFGKRAGEFAAKFAKENSLGEIDSANKLKTSRVKRCAHLSEASGENPYQVQHDLAGDDAGQWSALCATKTK